MATKQDSSKEKKRRLALWWPTEERKLPTERDFILEIRGIRAQIEEQCLALKIEMENNNWQHTTNLRACIEISGICYEYSATNKPYPTR
jgi:hypothetical protein